MTTTPASQPGHPRRADRGERAEGGGGLPVVYTPEQAAEVLRVRESWLRRKAAARLIPCTFLGRHLRFTAADLAAIVQAAAQSGTRAGVHRPRRAQR